jgi:hypothetical protein
MIERTKWMTWHALGVYSWETFDCDPDQVDGWRIESDYNSEWHRLARRAEEQTP